MALRCVEFFCFFVSCYLTASPPNTLCETAAKCASIALEKWKADCVAIIAGKIRDARQFVDVGAASLTYI
jgi:hypothetical protein